jgi:hypothetical protein
MPARRDDGSMPARAVVIVAFPGVQALDIAGPAEVLDRLRPGSYDVAVRALEPGAIDTGSGYAIAPVGLLAFARRVGVSPAACRDRFAA